MNRERLPDIPEGWKPYGRQDLDTTPLFIVPKNAVTTEPAGDWDERLRAGLIDKPRPKSTQEVFEEYPKFEESFVQSLQTTSRILGYLTSELHEMKPEDCRLPNTDTPYEFFRLADMYDNWSGRGYEPRVLITPYGLGREEWERIFQRATVDGDIEHNPLRQQSVKRYGDKRTASGLMVADDLTYRAWRHAYMDIPEDAASFVFPGGFRCTVSIVAGREKSKHPGRSYEIVHNMDSNGEEIPEAILGLSRAAIDATHSGVRSKKEEARLTLSAFGFSVGNVPVSLQKHDDVEQYHEDPNLRLRYGHNSWTVPESLICMLGQIIEGKLPCNSSMGSYCKMPEGGRYAPWVRFSKRKGCVEVGLQDASKGKKKLGFRHSMRFRGKPS